MVNNNSIKELTDSAWEKAEIGDYQNALVLLERALELNPSNQVDENYQAMARYFKVDYLQSINSLDEALDACNLAISSTPRGLFYVKKAQILFALGRNYEAGDILMWLLETLSESESELKQMVKKELSDLWDFEKQQYKGAERRILFNDNAESLQRADYKSDNEYNLAVLDSLDTAGVHADVLRNGLIEPNKTIAIASFSTMKRAALLFDQVVIIDDTVHTGMISEENNNSIIKYLISIPKESSLRNNTSWNHYKSYAGSLNMFKELFIPNPTPVLSSEDAVFEELPPGDSLAYVAALKNLPSIMENKLSWEQIHEFRKDIDSLRRYRDFRLWFRHTLNCTNIHEAVDLIGKKIDDYEYAIRKHGMQTRKELVSLLVDPKFLGKHVAVAAASGAYLGTPIGGFLAAGLTIVADIVVFLEGKKIERESIQRGENSEIAILYDARTRFLS